MLLIAVQVATATDSAEREILNGVVGELSVFQPEVLHTTNMYAKGDGVLAMMLSEGLQNMCRRDLVLGGKLMRKLAQVAFRNRVAKVRQSRSEALKPVMEWKKGRISTTVLNAAVAGAPAADNAAQQASLAEAHALALKKMLCRHGMTASQAEKLCPLAQYHTFAPNDVLVQPLCTCPQLLFVVQGNVLIESLKVEIKDEGILHAIEFFGGVEASVTS